MTILVFAIISNISQTSINNINDQFSKIYCPTPLYNYVDFLNGTIINSEVNSHTGRNFGTNYSCFFDPNSQPASTHVTASFINYNATGFANFPSGWFQYIGDFLAAYMYKLGAVENLISYVLTPINLNILGYTISNISGLALMFVIAIYVLAYIPIVIYVYKSVSPFVSG